MSTADELRELEMGAKEALSVDRTWTGVAAALIQAQALHHLADALAPLERIAGAMEANRARGEEPMPAKDHLPTQILPNGILVRGTPTPEQLVEILRLGGSGTESRPTPTPDQPSPTPSAPQEPQQPPSATHGGHPLDRDGWICSRVPTEGDADRDGEVKVSTRNGQTWFWSHWSTVVLGDPWVPVGVTPPPYAPEPLPAHIACPTSEGWVHDRVPGPEDGDEDGDVGIAAAGVRHWDEIPKLTDRQRIACAYIPWSHVVPGQPWRPLRTRTP